MSSILEGTYFIQLCICIVVCLYLSFHFHGALQNIDHVESKSHPNLPPLYQNQDSVDGFSFSSTKQHKNIIRGASKLKKLPGDSVSMQTTKARHGNTDGLSACLLVNDENPRLPEWLAYHYQMLPLRSLIVAVDPASRSSPSEILSRWKDTSMLEVDVWEDDDYFTKEQGSGLCDATNPKVDCVKYHRNRQRYFVMKCMAEFKRRNKTWVLLVDVDEYVTFNQIRDDDPIAPLDEAPDGIPTLSDWKLHTNSFGGVVVDGLVNGAPSELKNGVKDGNQNQVVVNNVITKANDVEYGNVIEDASGNKFYLRDDIAYRDATAMQNAPKGVPTLKDVMMIGTRLFARIFNDAYDGNKNGEYIEIKMGWENGDTAMRKFHGGHLIHDAKQKKYYIEREQESWPPHVSPKTALNARARLPSVGDGNTIYDILKNELNEYPCVTMPRLLYGSYEEDDEKPRWNADPVRFEDKDFVTLRYKWHAIKGVFDVNKYPKTIIDVSRVPMSTFDGKAFEIHRPLTKFCRKDPPRYSLSLLRVNHYADSFEAFSYRHDSRRFRKSRQVSVCVSKLKRLTRQWRLC
eukprot:g5712.t1.2.5e174189 g5712  g5712.t1 contig2:1134797-1136743(+)